MLGVVCLSIKSISARCTVNAVFLSSDDHKILVEPACGAALAAVYENSIHELMQQKRLDGVKNVLVIVCGGQGVSFQQLLDFKAQFNL